MKVTAETAVGLVRWFAKEIRDMIAAGREDFDLETLTDKSKSLQDERRAIVQASMDADPED